MTPQGSFVLASTMARWPGISWFCEPRLFRSKLAGPLFPVLLTGDENQLKTDFVNAQTVSIGLDFVKKSNSCEQVVKELKK